MKFSIGKISVAIIVLALIAGVVVGKSGPKKSTDETTGFGTVRKENLIQRVTISGQIWPKKRLDIRPPFKGYLVKLYVKIGDKVKAGAPIATFSPSLAGGETNFPIRAAFDGVVTQVLKGEGEYLTESDQNLVVRIEDVSSLSVMATVPELDVAKVKVGQEARIRVSAILGETFTGGITEINMSARDKDRWSSSSTEFQLRVLIKSNDPRLLPGMSAVMDIITDKRDQCLTLTHEYIQEDDKGYFVTLESGTVQRIKTGLQTEQAVEILDGLAEGARVKPIDFLSLPKVED